MLDVHYSGWLGILPTEIWSIIFRMSHQMSMNENVFSAFILLRTKWARTREGYTMFYSLPLHFSDNDVRKMLSIRLAKYCDDEVTIDGVLRNNPDPFPHVNPLTDLLRSCKHESPHFLQEQCSMNGLWKFSKNTRKSQVIKMLMNV